VNRKRLGLVLFDEVEVLDFCGPYEVFSATRLDEARRRQEPSPFEVVLVAEVDRPVVASGGMRILPEATFATCPALDLLVVPGGWGTRREMGNEALLAFLRTQAARVELLASVCTGALLLGRAGLLDGLRATTHWQSLQLMRELFPAVEVVGDASVVEAGKVFTSAGIAAGIDLALRVVGHYHGEAIARATSRHMEYPFPDTNTRGITP